MLASVKRKNSYVRETEKSILMFSFHLTEKLHSAKILLVEKYDIDIL